MSDKVKQLAPEIWDEIQKAKKILLTCHPSPDADSIGSALAMYLALKGLGKDATIIYGDSKKKSQNDFFPHYDEIIEKNYFEIGPENFDLLIACDSSSKEQISNKQPYDFPPNLTVINIDHHGSDTNYANINLVDPTVPAAAQLVYELLTELKITITPDMAICLYAGLYTDTGGFKYPMTSSDTLLYASQLVKIYPNFHKAIFQMENSYEPKQLEYLGLALSSIEHYFGNKVAISASSFKDLQDKGIEARHTEKMEISNTLKSAAGWDIGIAFVETEPNVCNVSLRTRDSKKYDLSKLAVAIGGGGHAAAAGGRIKIPFAEAKKYLLQKIAEVYPELGNP